MKPILTLRDISFSYNNKGNMILENISLNLDQGDFAAIVGPNGAGKSTLVKLILGLNKTNCGSVLWFNQPIEKFSHWEKIGYLSQKASYVNMGFPATVEEILKAALYVRKMDNKSNEEVKRKIVDVLNEVGLLGKEKVLIGTLSGGQQQKVFLARLLIAKPEVIILDEPMVGLDQQTQIDLYKLLFDLNKSKGITVLMVTHDLRYVSTQVNKLICVENGKVFCHQGECSSPHKLSYHQHFNLEKWLVGE